MYLVSVIVPNYNHESYLKERIDSILNQSYQNFEVIILDDCSTDNSYEVIELYRDHPKISHIVYNKVNSGSTFKQWNKGVSLAKGNWVWIAESDDTAEKELLQKLITPILLDSSIVLSYCQSNRMDSKGIITGDWMSQTNHLKRNYHQDFIEEGRLFIKEDLLEKNVLPNASAVLFKKQTFFKVRGADEDIRYNSDWLLWMKILTLGKISYVSDIFNNFRYHENSVIAKSNSDNRIPFIRKYDILMMKRFLQFLKNNSDSDIVSNVVRTLFIFNSSEFEFLFKKKYKKESIIFFINSLKYSNQKVMFFLKGINFIKHYS